MAAKDALISGLFVPALLLIVLLWQVEYAWGVERDLSLPRVPANRLADAKALKNPYPPSHQNLEKGKGIFEGKGTCHVCHGKEGKGDGLAAIGLDPSPRNFANPAFQAMRTDGELFWVIRNGSPGTAMMPMVGSVIDEQEAWLVLLYERSLSKK